jgi:hypothetical protein
MLVVLAVRKEKAMLAEICRGDDRRYPYQRWLKYSG